MSGASRLSLAVAVGGALLLGSLIPGKAAYPDRPVHFVVAFAAGGSADLLARLLGPKLTEKWGQPVVVENKAGADGSIGADFIAHSPPDGYNVGWLTNSNMIAPNLHKLNYDPVKSFAPISLVAAQYSVLAINPDVVPVNSVQELIEYVKAHPGKLNYGNAGPYNTTNLEMKEFMDAAGIDMVGVAYASSAPALVALLGGEVGSMMVAVNNAVGPLKTGKIKALAIEGPTRSPILPNVPTFAEIPATAKFAGTGVWYGAEAPAGTPKEIVTKLHDDMAEIMKQPDIKKVMDERGFDVTMSSPDQFGATIKSDLTTFAQLIKASNLK